MLSLLARLVVVAPIVAVMFGGLLIIGYIFLILFAILFGMLK